MSLSLIVVLFALFASSTSVFLDSGDEKYDLVHNSTIRITPDDATEETTQVIGQTIHK